MIASIRPVAGRVVARRSQRPVPRHRPGRRAASRPSPPAGARRAPKTGSRARVRGSDGRAGDRGVRGSGRAVPILTASDERLLELVQTGACDAAVVDADGVGRLRRRPRRPARAGDGANRGRRRLRRRRHTGRADRRRGGRAGRCSGCGADGTMHRLTRTWLGIDPARSAAAPLAALLRLRPRRSCSCRGARRTARRRGRRSPARRTTCRRRA